MRNKRLFGIHKMRGLSLKAESFIFPPVLSGKYWDCPSEWDMEVYMNIGVDSQLWFIITSR
jgi:hypothetical protein